MITVLDEDVHRLTTAYQLFSDQSIKCRDKMGNFTW